MPTTSRGALPYPGLAESPHGPDQMQALAARVAALYGAVPMTELERDALGGDDLYPGRVVLNTSSGRIEAYNGSAWVAAETPAGAQARVNEHEDRTDNPHQLTTAQIGASPTGHRHDQVDERTIASDTSHTLELSDAGKVVGMQPATGDVTLTVPANASVALPIGTVVEAYQHTGGGDLVVAPASGVTLVSPYGQLGSRRVAGQYASASLRKRATDQWVLQGDLK